ncbi:MAG TPA: glutathione S-transferase N-terminal domain-containing protein [Solirubrobacteraceae bacterium]|jgi:glutathione S-transferase|nr:glutathione S-transferase N-terminal domain-containing protein [Solirubrobacteraceae bacterium]
MAVKLHRCSIMFVKGPHPCWRVQKALDEAGVEYEVVKHPARRGRRTELIQTTGQKLLPAIELPDGTLVREESAQLVERIRAGKLEQQSAA